METVKLEDMTVVSSISLDDVLCQCETCPEQHKGLYINCYIHTYLQCPIFDEWYNEKYINPYRKV